MKGHSLEEAFRASSEGQNIWHWQNGEWTRYRFVGGVLRSHETKQPVSLEGKMHGWGLEECSCVWCTGKLETEVAQLTGNDEFDTTTPEDENGQCIFSADSWQRGEIIGLHWKRFPEIWRDSLDVDLGRVHFVSQAHPGLGHNSTIYTPGHARGEDARVLCWRPLEFITYETLRDGLERLACRAEDELRVST